MYRMIILTFICAMPLCSNAASAASLGAASGPVYVNQGTGYVYIAIGTPVSEGTQMFVPAGSTAVLSYETGCQMNIAGPSVLDAPAVPPCPQGANSVDFASITANAPPASYVGGAQAATPPPAPAAAAAGLSTTALVIGGVVVAGAVVAVAAAAAAGGDDDGGNTRRPASP